MNRFEFGGLPHNQPLHAGCFQVRFDQPLFLSPEAVREVKRNRIELPFDPDSYCEKNWMPILDKPFHYIKWANPTQVVKVSDDKNSCEVVYQSERTVPETYGFRGGSQVIRIPEGYLAIVHETNFGLNEHGTKNAAYPHRFVMWDENFEIIILFLTAVHFKFF